MPAHLPLCAPVSGNSLREDNVPSSPSSKPTRTQTVSVQTLQVPTGRTPSYVPGPLSLLCWVLLVSGRSPLGARAQPRTQPRSPPAPWGRAFVSGSQRPHMQTTPTVPPGDLPSPPITETLPQPLRPQVALPTPHPSFLQAHPSTPPPSGPFSAPPPHTQFLPPSLCYHKRLLTNLPAHRFYRPEGSLGNLSSRTALPKPQHLPSALGIGPRARHAHTRRLASLSLCLCTPFSLLEMVLPGYKQASFSLSLDQHPPLPHHSIP